MTVESKDYLECPKCGRYADKKAFVCSGCSFEIGVMDEDLRLVKGMLRYFSLSLLGAVLLSMAVLIPMGAWAIAPMALFTGSIVGLATAGVLWFCADSIQTDDEASPTTRP